MTVNMLIQIDKLVQLLESPVFTCPFLSINPTLVQRLTPTDLRLQLLEPEKYPFLYKCLYGVLMLLPQSSAFAALKNRLNSVSNIGFLHGGIRRYGCCSSHSTSKFTETNFPSTTQTAPSFDRATGTRLKTRDENSIRWVELLDKFKSVQERARRAALGPTRHSFDQSGPMSNPSLTAALSVAAADRPRHRASLSDTPRNASGASNVTIGNSALGSGHGAGGTTVGRVLESSTKAGPSAHKHKSSLPNLGRLGIGSRKSSKK